MALSVNWVLCVGRRTGESKEVWNLSGNAHTHAPNFTIHFLQDVHFSSHFVCHNTDHDFFMNIIIVFILICIIVAFVFGLFSLIVLCKMYQWT